MSVINIEHISKLYGDKMVLNNLSGSVDEGDKIGMIGVNGTGKSTLLRILAGDEEADTGEVVFSRGLTVGWLSQNPIFPEKGKILSYVCSDLKEMDYGFESEAKAMLNALEIYDHNEEIEHLSGGQKKRVALAKVLLKKTDILILDEPTNHLDNQMSDWLEQFLIRYKGVLLLVTHDRYFLDRVSNRIWEIDKGTLYDYDTNYSGFLERKAQREDIAQAAERKRQSILRVELAWVRRGARARSTKQKARLARYDTLKSMDAPQAARQVEMESVGTRLGKKTIELSDLSKSYGEKHLFTDFSYIFRRYERIGFVGPNGCGKSTLMKILAGVIPADSGEIVWGETIKIGYFAQECEVMDENQRVIDYIKDEAEYVRTGSGLITASRMLERFLFSPDMQYTPIAKISGGERRRLYLLKVLMSAPNVLILDEPTNDLDIPSLQVLEDFLDHFPGIVIVVSHDRYFLDRIADRICDFEEGNLTIYEGGYTDFVEKRKEIETAKKEEAKVQQVSEISKTETSVLLEKESYKAKLPKKLKFSFKEKREFETIEEDIAGLEEKIENLDTKISASVTDFVKLNEYMKEKEETEQKLEEKMERWVYLNDLSEQIEAQKGERDNL